MTSTITLIVSAETKPPPERVPTNTAQRQAAQLSNFFIGLCVRKEARERWYSPNYDADDCRRAGSFIACGHDT
jgi:hypothetical protein